MKKNIYLFAAFAFLATGTSFAQNVRNPMSDPNVNFYDIQRAAAKKWRGLERELQREQREKQDAAARAGTQGKPGLQREEENEEAEGGYFQYKRWEDFMAPRVYPSGDITLPSRNWENFSEYLRHNPDAMNMYQQSQYSVNHTTNPNVSPQSSTWTFAGPTGAPSNGGAGRVTFIRIDPVTSTTLYLGGPDGGLWKSTNGGTSWTTNTDQLSVIGCSDLAIDPTNTQIMYLATGDGDAGDSYSTGVLKSTDGGTTWNASGLNWTVNQGRVIRKLLMDPGNSQIIMAFSNAGIWRTTNGGTSWTQVLTNSCTDAEYMPGTPATVYACGTSFFKSTDGGATWSTITTGLPAAANVDRLAIAVTAANSAYVYLVAGSAANDGFYGFYRSTNSGTSFTQVTVSSPSNILGWASAGNDTGGQGWYDLVIAASPTNANEVCVGGVNIWRTTNGGTSWTLNAHWTGTGAPYVHADHHAMIYANGTTMYEGCDGGIFKTTNNGGAWTDISNNICIAQIYRIGLSTSSLNYWITGHQDNGTNLKNGASYSETMGGDGMDCFVDRTNNNVMYGEQYQGSLNRTTNGGAAWTAITTGLTGTAPWVTPWYQDPTTANTIYCGRTNLFKSTNQGTSWTQLTALPATPTGTIVDFRVAPSNNQVIYVARATGLFKTTNGGTSWTTVTGTIPTGSASISRIAVATNDPNFVLVTLSGYSSGNKVFKSTNGGTSWTNISTGLPNLPANCVTAMPGSTTGAFYLGMDVGVYYIDNTFTSWQPYFTGLPNVVVDDIEIYQATGKVRAATYGRGVWEVDIYNPGTLPPVALFAPSATNTCINTGVNFTDQSSFTPTSWSWTFPGGTPSTSTAQNPSGITWSAAGTYTVTLVATNANGSSTYTMTITVLGVLTPPLVEGFEATQFLPANWTANNINNDGIFWSQATTGNGSAKSALFDNYNLDVAGARDEMWAPQLNFAPITNGSMTFDVAYSQYDATYTDTLEVLVSTNCGASWTSVYLKGGTTLATAPNLTTALFVPTASQWRTETVNLSAYSGQSSVLIAFRNRGHYGQGLYVDNINITGTVSSAPTAAFTSSVSTVCAGTGVNFTDGSTGSPTSWSWTFPSGTPGTSTAQNPTGIVWNTAGTYTVTLVATNGSGSNSTTHTITVTALPTVTTTATSTTICSGNSTTITAAGATTYTWMPGSLTGTSVTVSPTITTTYTVTGTNASGCVNTSTRTITVNPTPTVTVTASSGTICSGNSTTLTATGGTTYSWMPGSLTGTSVTVSPTTTTTYTVTGTSTGCSSTSTQLITVNPTPTVTTTASSTTICSGSSTTLTASGGTTYTWMPGSLTGTSVTVSPTTTTTYTVTGTTGTCSATSTRLITVNPSPTVTTTASSTTICSGNSTTITASGGSTYSWMPGSLTGTSVTVSPTTTTTYTVTGTAVNGCTSTSTRLITVNPTPTVTVTASSGTICSGSSTTLTASGGTTYTWMPGSLTGGSVTVSPTTTTTYTVTGTSTGCSGTSTQLVTVNPSPTVTTTASSTTICSGNSTTLTASGGSTYSWMPGSLSGTSVTVSPTTTTTYTVTGTAVNGCTGTSTRLITVNPSPTVTATATSTSICTGNSTTLTGSGANTYAWMPGSLSGSSVTVTPGSTTTYTVTGTASNGCTNTNTVTINVGAQPTVTASSSNSSLCIGSSATLTASGTTSYTWMPGSLTGSSVTVSPTTTTSYTVTGTNGPGCQNTATVTVTVNALPTVTASATNSSICTGSSATLNASGASTYTWMPGSLSGATVTDAPTSSTTYTVTGVDANGCSNTQTVAVTVNALPTVSASASNATVCAGSSTTLSASGASTYTWMPGSLSGATVTDAPTSTTTYTVTGVDANGCSNTQTVAVTVNALPVITASATNTSMCVGNSTTLTASGASTYTWMPGSLTGASVTDTPASTTTYTVTGTDANSCSNTETVTVTVNALPTVTFAAFANDTICQSDAPFTLTGGSPAGGTYSGNGVSAGTFDPFAAGLGAQTITYDYTDVNGCSASATQTIYVDICTGIVPIGNSGSLGVTVMPNPSTGVFSLVVSVAKRGTYRLELVNTLGQLVYREDLRDFSGSATRPVDLTTKGAGTYFCRLTNGDEQVIVRIVVQ